MFHKIQHFSFSFLYALCMSASSLTIRFLFYMNGGERESGSFGTQSNHKFQFIFSNQASTVGCMEAVKDFFSLLFPVCVQFCEKDFARWMHWRVLAQFHHVSVSFDLIYTVILRIFRQILLFFVLAITRSGLRTQS